MLIYKRKIMCAPSREKGSQPRSSRPPCPGMVAVTILAGHRAPLPAKIVTPSLSGHGGCDDPCGPLCAPSRQYCHALPAWAWWL